MNRVQRSLDQQATQNRQQMENDQRELRSDEQSARQYFEKFIPTVLPQLEDYLCSRMRDGHNSAGFDFMQPKSLEVELEVVIPCSRRLRSPSIWQVVWGAFFDPPVPRVTVGAHLCRIYYNRGSDSRELYDFLIIAYPEEFCRYETFLSKPVVEFVRSLDSRLRVCAPDSGTDHWHVFWDIERYLPPRQRRRRR